MEYEDIDLSHSAFGGLFVWFRSDAPIESRTSLHPRRWLKRPSNPLELGFPSDASFLLSPSSNYLVRLELRLEPSERLHQIRNYERSADGTPICRLDTEHTTKVPHPELVRTTRRVAALVHAYLQDHARNVRSVRQTYPDAEEPTCYPPAHAKALPANPCSTIGANTMRALSTPLLPLAVLAACSTHPQHSKHLNEVATPTVVASNTVTPSSEEQTSTPPIVSRLSGKWIDPDQTCVDTPHTITFAVDLLPIEVAYDHVSPTLYWKDQGPAATYQVRSLDETSVHVRLENEGRKDDAGSLVEWDIISREPGSYCWRRSDWTADTCTDPRTRCP